jgi:putative hydrolase of the HAD superfamily
MTETNTWNIQQLTDLDIDRLLAEGKIDRPPQVIFLDAVGTLFEIGEPVGGVYAKFAEKYGVSVDRDCLDIAFYKTFKNASPCTFPELTDAEIPAAEYQWWATICRETFKKCNIESEFDNFDLFFTELYEYFTTASAWKIYPETIIALRKWQQKGIQLGVISNFDTRLLTVLKILNISEYFQTTTISSLVGAAKPDKKVFQTALAAHQCLSENAWHVGDSWREDIEGALAAGLTAIYLWQPDGNEIDRSNQ